jgi:hypothetical protein
MQRLDRRSPTARRLLRPPCFCAGRSAGRAVGAHSCGAETRCTATSPRPLPRAGGRRRAKRGRPSTPGARDLDRPLRRAPDAPASTAVERRCQAHAVRRASLYPERRCSAPRAGRSVARRASCAPAQAPRARLQRLRVPAARAALIGDPIRQPQQHPAARMTSSADSTRALFDYFPNTEANRRCRSCERAHTSRVRIESTT